MDVGYENLRVLLVDDNPHMRAIVAAVLKGLGVRHIREAGDGTQALVALRDWPCDVAIVDFQMTPMDGAEFTRRVRRSPTSANPYLPIVMMTGHAERARVIEARDAGVTEFLVKPVTARAVIDRLNSSIYRPREFVRAGDYFGPTRRRAGEPDAPHPTRRVEDKSVEI